MRVVTFGEALFRFSVPLGGRLSHADQVGFFLAGTELNVAANLVALGVHTDWVSCLPQSDLGRMMSERIARLNVGMQFVRQVPGRAGWYLHESGASPRPDVVIERQASVMADLQDFALDWSAVFKHEAKIFHTSGVSSGLSASSTAEVARAMKAARSAGAKVSYDFNFRKNLWSLEESTKRQKPLLQDVDYLFCSREELKLYFGWNESDTAFANVFAQGPFRAVILSVRGENESTYGIDIVTREALHASPRFPITHVDRIGVGDAMTAAVLAGLCENLGWSEIAALGAAAGALKYTIRGDMALLKREELTRLVESGYRGVIR